MLLEGKPEAGRYLGICQLVIQSVLETSVYPWADSRSKAVGRRVREGLMRLIVTYPLCYVTGRKSSFATSRISKAKASSVRISLPSVPT